MFYSNCGLIDHKDIACPSKPQTESHTAQNAENNKDRAASPMDTVQTDTNTPSQDKYVEFSHWIRNQRSSNRKFSTRRYNFGQDTK